MSIYVIKECPEKAKTEQVLKAKLKACIKITELITLANGVGYPIDEASLYPPNEP